MALSEPVAVDIPQRAPQVAILSPADGATVRTDSNLHLSGMATTSDGRILDGEALQWEIDGQRAGSGAEIWVLLPEWEDEHKAVLRATDGSLTGKASVIFIATNSGQQVYRMKDC